ncbi:hypothetical protein D3C73_1456150 [compost metagenome]
MISKHSGSRFARIRYAECKQEGSQITTLAVLNSLKQIVRLLLTETIQLDQIIKGQCI